MFEKYEEISAKDHERLQRGDENSTKYNLNINSPLPKHDSIQKNKHNKRQLSHGLSMFDYSDHVESGK